MEGNFDDKVTTQPIAKGITLFNETVDSALLPKSSTVDERVVSVEEKGQIVKNQSPKGATKKKKLTGGKTGSDPQGTSTETAHADCTLNLTDEGMKESTKQGGSPGKRKRDDVISTSVEAIMSSKPYKDLAKRVQKLENQLNSLYSGANVKLSKLEARKLKFGEKFDPNFKNEGGKKKLTKAEKLKAKYKDAFDPEFLAKKLAQAQKSKEDKLKTKFGEKYDETKVKKVGSQKLKKSSNKEEAKKNQSSDIEMDMATGRCGTCRLERHLGACKEAPPENFN